MMKALYTLVAVLTLLPSAYADWFVDGERLYYKISWGFLNAGEAELSYMPSEDYRRYFVSAFAWTDSSFFNLKEKISVVGQHGEEGTDTFQPQVYTVQQIENDYRAHKKLDFTPKTGVTFQNIRAKEQPVPFEVLEGARDYFSALYALRKRHTSIEVGKTYSLPVAGMKKGYTLDVDVIRKTKMKTYLGKQEVFEIRPVFRELGQTEPKKKRWTLWVTADGQYIPVQISVKMNFGTFKARLKGISGIDTPSRAPAALVSGRMFQE